MCWVSVAGVDVKPSISLPFWLKSFFIASFTHSWLLDQSYSKTTTLSNGTKHSWIFCGVGLALTAQNAEGTSLYAFQLFHAVFLPLPPKYETVSHPFKAWNIGMCNAYLGCSIKWKFFSNTKAKSQHFSKVMPLSWCYDTYNIILCLTCVLTLCYVHVAQHLPHRETCACQPRHV